MSENLKDEFHFQTAGTLIAIRVVLAALLKDHPDPQKLLKNINELVEISGARKESFPTPIRENFDSILNELSSHLEVRTTHGD